jgi:hypothetical protein
MRVTFNRRRVALAAVLVVGGAAAPLAWATVGSRPGSAPVRSAPLRLASPQAATATADNPYQVSLVVQMTANVVFDIPSMNLPAGVNFALTQATVISDVPLVLWNITPVVKTGAGTFTASGIPLPLDADGRAGFYGFDWVIKPNTQGAAAVGDITDIGFHVQNGGAPGTATFILTGQKITGTTAVTVRDFTARPRAHGALLRWTTGSESNLLGFNVWRVRRGTGVKLNRTLVPAKRSGEPSGASYAYLDAHPGVRKGLTYRLQLVDLHGRRSWYAAFAIPA